MPHCSSIPPMPTRGSRDCARSGTTWTKPVAPGLRARGAARFAFARRDEPAEATLDLLTTLVERPNRIDGRP